MINTIILIGLLIFCLSAQSKKEINAKIDKTQIMYGSTIRIKAAAFSYYLHSHTVNYPLGSGLQSVTGFPADNDYNSLWTLKQPNDQGVKTYQEQVKCGDSIRLEHALTKRNLHSEQLYQSMITKNQEVSCYGREGQGDDNDNWILKCVNKAEEQVFYGSDVFQLIHENTQKRLKMSKFYQYSYNNWQNCPFQGQLQVSALDKATKQTQFKVVGGVFFKDTDQNNEQRNLGDEL